jgi:hypothetical protein
LGDYEVIVIFDGGFAGFIVGRFEKNQEVEKLNNPPKS